MFAIYRAIPFAFELKMLLDWTFTATTLNFYYWAKLEDINAALYRRKCDLVYERSTGRKLGDPQPWNTKAGSGLLLFLGICILLFFPLFFYGSANQYSVDNYIDTVQVKIGIRGYDSLYENNIVLSGPSDTKYAGTIKYFGEFFARDKNIANLDFKELDPSYPFQVFTLPTYSNFYWLVSSPSRKNMISSINNFTQLVITYTVNRRGPATQTTVSASQTLNFLPSDTAILKRMIDMDVTLANNITIPFAYNPYIQNKPTELVRYPFTDVEVTKRNNSYYPICTFGVYFNETDFAWWNMECKYRNFTTGGESRSGPVLFFQSRKVVVGSGIIQYISSLGIIAFYTTFVLAVHRLLRPLWSDIIGRIMYEDFDDCDLLLKYVEDIYLARANKELLLEESMYNHLIGVIKDPSTLLLWTKPKVD